MAKRKKITKPKGQAKDKAEKNPLNPKQLMFCKLYASKEFYGNGVEAYAEAYDIDLTLKGKYKAAQAASSRLLSNGIILKHINTLLDAEGLNDAFVDKQLLHVITQNAEYGAKVSGIREYNKLKQRIQDKLQISFSPDTVPLFPATQQPKDVSKNNSDK